MAVTDLGGLVESGITAWMYFFKERNVDEKQGSDTLEKWVKREIVCTKIYLEDFDKEKSLNSIA